MPSSILAKESSSTFAQARKYWSNGLPWATKGSLAVVDQGLISGTNFLMGILLARWLAPEQYGAYALAFSVFLFLTGFHSALLLEPMSVFGPASYGKRLRAYVRKLIGLHFVLVFFLTGLVLAAIAVLRYLTADLALRSALWGVCIAAPLILFYWLCRRAAYIKLFPGLAARGASVYCLVLICLLILIQRSGWLSSFTAFLIQALAATAAGVLLLNSLRSWRDSESGPSNSTIVGQHWRYGRWPMATQLVYWLSGNAYYVIVAAFFPMQDVAALRALRNFTLPFGQFLSAASLLLLPWASAQFAEKGGVGFKRRIRQITILFVGAASCYLAVLCLFGGRFMEILYAGRYMKFAYLLPVVAAPVVVLAASQGSTIAVQAMQAPAEVLIAYSVAGAVTILAGLALARFGGLPGALIGILTSSVGFCVVITWRCQKRLAGLVSVEIPENI